MAAPVEEFCGRDKKEGLLNAQDAQHAAARCADNHYAACIERALPDTRTDDPASLLN